MKAYRTPTADNFSCCFSVVDEEDDAAAAAVQPTECRRLREERLFFFRSLAAPLSRSGSLVPSTVSLGIVSGLTASRDLSGPGDLLCGLLCGLSWDLSRDLSRDWNPRDTGGLLFFLISRMLILLILTFFFSLFAAVAGDGGGKSILLMLAIFFSLSAVVAGDGGEGRQCKSIAFSLFCVSLLACCGNPTRAATGYNNQGIIQF